MATEPPKIPAEASSGPTVVTDEMIEMLEDLSIKAENPVAVPLTQEVNVKIVTPAKYAHFHCPRTLPTPEQWPDRPMLLRHSAVTSGLDSTSMDAPLRIGQPFPIRSKYFEGMGILRLRAVPGAETYFAGAHLKHRHKGRKMMSSFVVTGRFKEDIPFANVLTGQEFCHPIRVPGLLVGKAVLQVFKLLAPLLRVNVTKEAGNYMLSPLAQTVQSMNVSKEPVAIEQNTVVEESNELVFGKELSFVERKKILGKASELAKHVFKKEYYYTFDFYDDKLDFSTFELNAVRKFDLVSYLLGQPIRLLAKIDSTTDDYLWNVEIWHETQTEQLQKGS